MAENKSTLMPKGTTADATPSTDHVFLHEWWLVNAKGKGGGDGGGGLAVGGFGYRDPARVSLFCSAPILKRLNATTVLARDGTAVSLNGLINARHTTGNGYSAEVCNKFRLGFPYDWDDYAACNAPPSCNIRADGLDKSKPSSSMPRTITHQTIPEDVPASSIRDMPKRRDLKSLMNDILADIGNPKEKDEPVAEFVGKGCPEASPVIDRAGGCDVDDDIMPPAKKEQNTRCQWEETVCSLNRTGVSLRRVKRCLKASLGEDSAGYNHNLRNVHVEVETALSNQPSHCVELEDCSNQMVTPVRSLNSALKVSSRKDVSVQDLDRLDNIECHVVNPLKKDQSNCYETIISPRSIRSCRRLPLVQDVIEHEQDIELTTSPKQDQSNCCETSTSPRSIRSRLRSSVVQDVPEHKQNPDIEATTSLKKDQSDCHETSMSLGSSRLRSSMVQEAPEPEQNPYIEATATTRKRQRGCLQPGRAANPRSRTGVSTRSMTRLKKSRI